MCEFFKLFVAVKPRDAYVTDTTKKLKCMDQVEAPPLHGYPARFAAGSRGAGGTNAGGLLRGGGPSNHKFTNLT